MTVLSGCSRSVSGTPLASEDSGPASTPDLAAIAGEWIGSYTCAQGATGLKLTVDDTGRTEFEFYSLQTNVAAESGKFEMRATADGEQIEFAQVRWIVRPQNYSMVDLVATEVTSDIMRGTVESAGCSTFEVSRDDS
ncbi:hypothetical protein [Nocardia sp. NPDC019395]|uniref:hypothetical protein n=1 Tax=Nocardia sp. NPDC019395 TaxID=3154686 RepID=UPI00340FF778